MTIKYLIVHCSASPQGRGDNAAVIHRWHQDRGFDGIGYHAVITEDGTIQQGRPEYWRGAQCRGHNSESLGVCLIGEGSDATPEQYDALEKLLVEWERNYPEAAVIGHCDLDPNKSCPGFNVARWWEER